MINPAQFHSNAAELQLLGSWTVAGCASLPAQIAALPHATAPLRIDATRVETLDTVGAMYLLQLVRGQQARGRPVEIVGLRVADQALLDLVAARGEWVQPEPERPYSPLEGLGRAVIVQARAGFGFLSFIGATFAALGLGVLRPQRLRGRAIVATLSSAGVHALPIVALMAFLLGVVIAYQGGLQLKSYGANIFIVELVTLTMLRELAPLIAAIMVAGRTGSAFTAQIGTMLVTEEVDALRTIGIDPLEMLVVPKLVALLIALPLLTVFADILSVLGGMVMAQFLLDVSFNEFIDRIPQAVSVTSLLVGIGKAPVFAVIIALVGCYQGFQVTASAESVGQKTTVSVVQSIFLVIVADAAFSVVLGALGI